MSLLWIVATLGVGAMTTAKADPAAAVERTVLKVMSFNIRYGAANDGENSWPQRRELVRETIATFDPDLLGLQEALELQVDFLRAGLPAYDFHGVGREDGKRQGEFVPVLFRRDRFDLLDSGHFWLSETPEVPGSKSWDSSLPRMLSWVALADRHNEDRPFVFANVHFDHRGAEARRESATLIRRRAGDIPAGMPIVLTGDFNTTEDLPPYRELIGARPDDAVRFLDTYRVRHPQTTPFEATFNNWQPVREGQRIDWILITSPFRVLNASINHTQDGERLPSDHYPVEAVIRFVE